MLINVILVIHQVAIKTTPAIVLASRQCFLPAFHFILSRWKKIHEIKIVINNMKSNLQHAGG